MCDWVNLPYSKKVTEHCRPTIKEKNKNHLKKRKKEATHSQPKIP